MQFLIPVVQKYNKISWVLHLQLQSMKKVLVFFFRVERRITLILKCWLHDWLCGQYLRYFLPDIAKWIYLLLNNILTRADSRQVAETSTLLSLSPSLQKKKKKKHRYLQTYFPIQSTVLFLKLVFSKPHLTMLRLLSFNIGIA